MEYMKTAQIIRCRDCKYGVPKAKRDQVLWTCTAHGDIKFLMQQNGFCSFAQPRYPACTMILSCAWCAFYRETHGNCGICSAHRHNVQTKDFCSDAVLAGRGKRAEALGLIDPLIEANSALVNPLGNLKPAEIPVKRHIFRFRKSKKGDNAHEVD